MAGHTHGGQLCLPFYGALVTNCDLDRSRAKGASRWGAGHRPARLGGHRHLAVRAVAVLLPTRGHPADAGRRADRGPRREPECGAVQPNRVDALTTGEEQRRGSQPPPRLGRQRHPADRGRRPAQCRHPPAALPAPVGVVRRRRRPAVSQGRVDPHHRQPQAPAGTFAVPLRAVQRLDRRAHHRRGGVVGVDGGLGGVLRRAARPAVRRGDAGLHQPVEGRADRIPGRPLPFRRTFG